MNPSNSASPRERVALSRCAPETADADIVRATEELIARLGELPERLRSARTIAVKINAGVPRFTLTDGRQTELTEPAVIEGTVRALRRQTDALLLIGDGATDGDTPLLYEGLGLPERLAPYPNVRLVDFNETELTEVAMPHGDPMFRRYWMPRPIVEADAVVSVAKMKAHGSLGCTLCIKNLFGWMPTKVYGVPRMYLHDRLIRLPRVLSDLARWLQPSLNVVDGIVAQNSSEWGGDPLRPGVLIAGTNPVATDSVGARVMGFGPDDDYPQHPFLYRRNAIRLAARAGLGPNDLSQIEVLGPSPESVVTPFTVRGYDEQSPRREQIARRNEEVRRGAATVAAYLARRDEFLGRYGAGRVLALFDGEVQFDAADVQTVFREQETSGRDWRRKAQFVVRCVPPDADPEVYEWYAREVAELPDPAA